VQARNNFERQEFLLKRGVVSRATCDEATERLPWRCSPSAARICRLWASHTLTGIDDGYCVVSCSQAC